MVSRRQFILSAGLLGAGGTGGWYAATGELPSVSGVADTIQETTEGSGTLDQQTTEGSGTLDIGETVTHDAFKMAVTQVQVTDQLYSTYTDDTGSVRTPERGAVFVAAYIQIEHIGETQRGFPNPYIGDVYIIYKEKEAEEEADYVPAEGAESYSENYPPDGAYPGTTAEGWIAHELPENFVRDDVFIIIEASDTFRWQLDKPIPTAEPMTQTTEAKAPAEEKTPSRKETPAPRSIGETVTHGGLKMAVTRVQTANELITSTFDNENAVTPSQGAVFVAVYVRIKHVGEIKNTFPGGVDMKYKGKNVDDMSVTRLLKIGDQKAQAYIDDYSKKDAAEAYPGTTVEGWVFFQLPEGFSRNDITVSIGHRGPKTSEFKTFRWQLN